jgi:flagellar biosynthetic protein FliS
MDQKLRDYYLEFQIKNSTPGQRLVMLYDGLIGFVESVESELSTAQTPENSSHASNHLSRSINILLELSTSLNHSVDPKLCGTLHDLYRFFMHELSESYNAWRPERVRAILPLLRTLRDTWFQADQQANKFQAVAA